jgi:hypothetical protein
MLKVTVWYRGDKHMIYHKVDEVWPSLGGGGVCLVRYHGQDVAVEFTPDVTSCEIQSDDVDLSAE